jgi:DNA-binding NarL/FixJ family response regulator
MTDLRILIADDHELIRRGVRDLLSSRAQWSVVAEARNGTEAVCMTSKHQPDIAILDFSMPELDAPSAIQAIKRTSPGTHIIVLTMHDGSDAIRRVLEAGAHGYVLKSDADEDLISAVEAVSRGRHFFNAQAAEMIVTGYLASNTSNPNKESSTRLTDRENEVLSLLAHGLTNKEIAARLKISTRTAESHRININRKLHFSSISDLMRYAIGRGIVAPS